MLLVAHIMHYKKNFCSKKVLKDIIARDAIPDKAINLGGEFGEIPLVTIGDNAFPRFAWLLKMFNENTHRFPGMLL